MTNLYMLKLCKSEYADEMLCLAQTQTNRFCLLLLITCISLYTSSFIFTVHNYETEKDKVLKISSQYMNSETLTVQIIWSKEPNGWGLNQRLVPWICSRGMTVVMKMETVCVARMSTVGLYFLLGLSWIKHVDIHHVSSTVLLGCY